MSAQRSYPWLAVLFAAAACGGPPSLDATDSSATLAPADAESCRGWLARAVVAIERGPMQERWTGVLDAVASGCPALPEPLREAAALAARGSTAARPAVLAAALDSHETAGCGIQAADAPALEVAAHCPMPPPFDFAPELLRDLDAGTYLFGRALALHFARLDLLAADGRRVVDTLLLSAAISNEALRPH
jgi:hypothetical protein